VSEAHFLHFCTAWIGTRCCFGYGEAAKSVRDLANPVDMDELEGLTVASVADHYGK